MEKKIGKNVSSGAEKVETVENKYTAEQVDAPNTQQKKSTKSTKSASKKRAPAASVKKEKKPAKKLEKAEKKERAAAKVRLEKAKKKQEKKERKLEEKVELKQKKVEKKAALKAKKEERKALAVQKKAERKQKKLEKKAALKEKKVERRAEKIARREMLKNETKAEKNKRIAREKREKIALKRRKQESREKARAEKIKAREAAHARKAEERKHKRETRTQRKRDRRGFGGWLAAVISLGVACLALATVVTAGAFRMNDMALEAESGARATLFEMVSVSEDMDDNLSKLRVASGVDEQRRLLTDLLVDSAVMESALEKIPVDAATGTDISAFVNRAGSYAKMLLSRLASGKTLTASQKETLGQLYEINAAMYGELNELATHMTQKQFSEFLAGNAGEISSRLSEAGAGIRKGTEEIAEAPFAGHGNVGENKLASLDEITEGQAQERAAGYFAPYHVRDIRCTGETNAQNFTCYNFVLTDENGTELYAQITKNGGMLAFFDTYEECTEKNFDLAMCDKIAREYLASLGIENVEAVWLSDAGMTADITYVSDENGVRAYPDMIRVRVCESKGRVVGIDARGYLLNHGERSLKAAISETEARGLLADGLEVTAANLALIPFEGEETLCYEFFCKLGEDEYVIYLDADTGMETEVFRVRQSARGSYLD